MPIKADYHLHSSFSGDSQTPMKQMIERGIELGLSTMCFTEHIDMDYPYDKKEDEGMFDLNTYSYLYDLACAKGDYADKIKILFGIEIGVQPHLAFKLAEYARTYEFDFIIASSHVCNHKDPYYPAFYEGRSDEEAYREYFSSIMDNLEAFPDFDVYGHLDYVVRYGKTKDADYSYTKYADYIDPILKLLIDQEKALEINTAGLRYGLRETNPCLDIVKRYHELGGELITIGSDAHKPEDVGYALDKAGDLLEACGFHSYTTFSHRKAEQRLLK